jgi:hypothetical protein
MAGFPRGGGSGSGVGISATTVNGGQAFNGVSDYTAAIQAAINATPSGGTLILPTGYAPISSALTISKSIRIMGSGCRPIAESISTDFNSINTPTVSPYLAGTVLVQNTAATDGIQVTGGGCSVDLRDFGILFGSSIIFSNTGHGINVTPPAVSSEQDNGLRSSRWQDLFVFGHDGNHYGYVVTNPVCCQFDKLQSFAGGGFHFINNGVTSPQDAYYGNFQCNSCYSQTFVSGSAHGTACTNASLFQNLEVFVRHQSTVANLSSSFGSVTPPTSAQYEYYDDGASQNITFVQPDFETNVGSAAQPPSQRFSIGTVGWFGTRGTPVVPGGESLTTWLALAQRGTFVDAMCEYRSDLGITNVADDTAIAAWPDISGNGYNLTQSTGGDQPTFYKSTTAKLINGLPAVWFSGAQYMVNTTIPTTSQPVTMVVVGIYTSSFSGTPVMLADGSAAHAVELAAGATPTLEMYAGTVLGGGTPVLGDLYLQIGVFNGSSSLLRVNGTALESGAAGSNAFTGGVVVGASASIAQFLTGAISHVIIFPYALNVLQCEAIEAFMANHWGT